MSDDQPIPFTPDMREAMEMAQRYVTATLLTDEPAMLEVSRDIHDVSLGDPGFPLLVMGAAGQILKNLVRGLVKAQLESASDDDIDERIGLLLQRSFPWLQAYIDEQPDAPDGDY